MIRALILLLLLSAPAYADRKTEEILIVISQASDILSTELWINQGGSEGNPILLALGGNSLHRRIALKSAATTGTILLARLLERKNHPKLASTLRWASIIPTFSATGWNISLIVRN